MLIALCVSQTGSLFSADSWHDITFVAGEVRNPRRNLPRSPALGTSMSDCALSDMQSLLPRGAPDGKKSRRLPPPGSDGDHWLWSAVLPGIGRLAWQCSSWCLPFENGECAVASPEVELVMQWRRMGFFSSCRSSQPRASTEGGRWVCSVCGHLRSFYHVPSTVKQEYTETYIAICWTM